MALVETVAALAVIFAILVAVMHLARLGRAEQHRQLNRRPGWLERSPNGSVMAPWRESPHDHHQHHRRR